MSTKTTFAAEDEALESQEESRELVNSIGTDQIVRTERGLFAKGHTANIMSPAKKVSIWFRKHLNSVDKDDPEAKLKLERMFNNLYLIACDNNPKYRKEAVWAFSALMDRAYGPPLKSQEELDAMAQGGMRIVMVTPMQIDEKNVPQVIDAEPVFVRPDEREG